MPTSPGIHAFSVSHRVGHTPLMALIKDSVGLLLLKTKSYMGAGTEALNKRNKNSSFPVKIENIVLRTS